MIYNQKFVFFAIIFLFNFSLQCASHLPHINKNLPHINKSCSHNLTQSSNVITGKVKGEANNLAKSQPIPIPYNKNYEEKNVHEEYSPSSPLNKGFQKLFVGYKQYSHYPEENINSSLGLNNVNRVSPNYYNDNTPSPLTLVTTAFLMNGSPQNNSLRKSQK